MAMTDSTDASGSTLSQGLQFRGPIRADRPTPAATRPGQILTMYGATATVGTASPVSTTGPANLARGRHDAGDRHPRDPTTAAAPATHTPPEPTAASLMRLSIKPIGPAPGDGPRPKATSSSLSA